MEIHGGLPQEFLFCEAGNFRDYGQQLLHNTSLQNQLRCRTNRDTLSLKLEPDPIPECLGTFLETTGHSPILGSPDMNLLKLESPELERLIMNQQNDNGDSASSNRNYTITNHRNIETSKSSKAMSPLMSADDLQFITETNQALESILPRSTHSRIHKDDFKHTSMADMENFFEPLQQVPDSDLTFRVRAQKRKDSINAHPHYLFKRPAENDNIIQTHENFNFTSSSPTFNDRIENRDCRTTSNFERFSNTDNVFDNNAAYMYDLNQPTMVANRFSHNVGCRLEKDQQNGLSMLPLPPIDLEVQEIVKRERKKLKNRVAASKCRKKKLEREAQLEVRVQHLKEKNIELNALANALRQQATELKQRIMEHMSSGCHTRLLHY